MVDLPEMKSNSLLRVTWLDSNFAKGWHASREQTAEVPKIVTVGYVTAATEDVLELTSTIAEDGGKLNPLSIPTRTILTVEKLQGVEMAEKAFSVDLQTIPVASVE